MINNKQNVPLEHYLERFSAADPEKMSLRSGISYENNAFSLRFLSREVKLLWPSMEAYFVESEEPLFFSERLLLARLVLEGTSLPASGAFRSYQEMPWGNVYLTQFTGRVIKCLAGSFGRNLAGFSEACERLGGTKVSSGDIAYEIPFVEDLILRLLLWEPDEEFGPSAQVLFSDNFAAAFTAEDMAVVGDIIIKRMR